MKTLVILKESINNLKRFQELNVQSVIILAIALYMLGIYFIIESNIKEWLKNLEQKVEIVCYLNDGLKDTEINKIINDISAKQNIIEANYISKNEALVNFVNDPEIGEQIKILGENPLPASLNIKLKDKHPDVVESFVEELKKEFPNEFEEISYAKDEVKNLSSAFAWIKYGGSIVGIIFFLLTLLLLIFTLKIARTERRDELKIMKLMGSDHSFLVKPFFYEGLMIGILSFILSFAILLFSFYFFNLKFQIVFIGNVHIFILLIIALLVQIICDLFVLRQV